MCTGAVLQMEPLARAGLRAHTGLETTSAKLAQALSEESGLVDSWHFLAHLSVFVSHVGQAR